jgi:hypothetical protein
VLRCQPSTRAHGRRRGFQIGLRSNHAPFHTPRTGKCPRSTLMLCGMNVGLVSQTRVPARGDIVDPRSRREAEECSRPSRGKRSTLRETTLLQSVGKRKAGMSSDRPCRAAHVTNRILRRRPRTWGHVFHDVLMVRRREWMAGQRPDRQDDTVRTTAEAPSASAPELRG